MRGAGATTVRGVAIAVACLALAACVEPARSATGPLKAAPDGRRLELTFQEEFDSFRPWRGQTGVWRTTFGDGSVTTLGARTLQANKELQLYVDPDMTDGEGKVGLNPFHLKDGVLTIRAERTPERLKASLGGYGYVSGLITSQPSFRQTYGYFEMRAALPRGKGLWPAFWLLPQDLSWPPEIDVMESIGDPAKVFATAHSKAGKAKGIETTIAGEGFHTFAVAWDARELIWFVNGVETGRQPTPPDMHKPMYLLANLAMGGDWAGAPDASTQFPAGYAIDYIRAYRFAP